MWYICSTKQGVLDPKGLHLQIECPGSTVELLELLNGTRALTSITAGNISLKGQEGSNRAQ